MQIHGTLQTGHTIAAANVEVVNPAGGSKLYKYAVSSVGAVLVLALFFRRWRFDPEALAFETRAKAASPEGGMRTDGDTEVKTDG
ncbi:hypothetical protein ACFQL4_25575 [Halosimplex aquaticum]